MPDALAHRPALAVDIARVAGYWSDVELQWTITYTYLLGGSDQDAFSEYYGLRDWRKRRSLFKRAASEHKLPGPLKAEAETLYGEFEQLSTIRNRVVHGAWAWHPKYEDALFLAQPRYLGENINQVFKKVKMMARHPKPQVSHDLGRGVYDLYKHEDFEEIVKQISDFKPKLLDLGQRILTQSINVLVRTLLPRT